MIRTESRPTSARNTKKSKQIKFHCIVTGVTTVTQDENKPTIKKAAANGAEWKAASENSILLIIIIQFPFVRTFRHKPTPIPYHFVSIFIQQTLYNSCELFICIEALTQSVRRTDFLTASLSFSPFIYNQRAYARLIM